MTDPHLLPDEERFASACRLVSLIEAENAFVQPLDMPGKAKRPVSRRSREGEVNIGGLGEGTLHLVLKNYISTDRSQQEISYGKKYIDVFLDGRAYEIQTRHFSSLKTKLDAFLPAFPVTVIFPVLREKRIAWLDPETGQLSAFRKSPKKESIYTLFSELIYLKDYLQRDSLSFCVFELAAEELRLLCGKRSKDRKKGSVRLNRVPTALYGIIQFESSRDFLRLLPPEETLTVKSLAAYAGISGSLARKTIYCLSHAGLLTCCGSYKREKLYCRQENLTADQN